MHIHIYIYIHINMYIYIYRYMYTCVYICPKQACDMCFCPNMGNITSNLF